MTAFDKDKIPSIQQRQEATSDVQRTLSLVQQQQNRHEFQLPLAGVSLHCQPTVRHPDVRMTTLLAGVAAQVQVQVQPTNAALTVRQTLAAAVEHRRCAFYSSLASAAAMANFSTTNKQQLTPITNTRPKEPSSHLCSPPK